MKTDLSKYNNSWYNPGTKVKRLLWYMVSIVFFQSSWNIFSGSRIFWLKLFGTKVGKGVVIKPKVTIKYPWKLIIGNNCWIGECVWIDNLDIVTIEDNVCLSQGAFLLCGNHNYKKVTVDVMIAPIYLEEGSWVGARSIVTPGVRLHSHSVLSVGSVATSNLEAYSIYSGNPAKKIPSRDINSN